MRILVLGHNGMLGRSVLKYFSQLPDYEILTTANRWGDDNFKNEIILFRPEFVINCIGKIPQKYTDDEVDDLYNSINVALPRFLDTLGIKIIHPSTDCEFKGDLKPGETYSKTDIRDADDAYGMSKSLISKELEENGNNTKIIRTSIIGHEEYTNVALLDWFLAQTGSVRGYTNHFWNGITTLEWAKQCKSIIENWEIAPLLNQLGTATHYSKFEIISLAKDIYKKNIEIIPFQTDITVNKCLASDKDIPELAQQLQELKSFFGK